MRESATAQTAGVRQRKDLDHATSLPAGAAATAAANCTGPNASIFSSATFVR
jgi:hypothetical protein